MEAVFSGGKASCRCRWAGSGPLTRAAQTRAVVGGTNVPMSHKLSNVGSVCSGGGGCPVCDPRDWRRSTGSVAVGLMECGSRYTVEDSGFHAQFNTLRGIPPAITISMREWDLRSHGPMFAKMDSTPRLPRLDGMATGHTSACHAFCRNMFPLGHGAMICCVCAAMRATPGSPCYPYGITGCMVDGSRDIYRHWAHVCS